MRGKRSVFVASIIGLVLPACVAPTGENASTIDEATSLSGALSSHTCVPSTPHPGPWSQGTYVYPNAVWVRVYGDRFSAGTFVAYDPYRQTDPRHNPSFLAAVLVPQDALTAFEETNYVCEAELEGHGGTPSSSGPPPGNDGPLCVFQDDWVQSDLPTIAATGCASLIPPPITSIFVGHR